MKATKNTVLKYSPYTTALTRSLKAAERLHCRVYENDDTAVYVCNGYFVAKLNRAEYDVLVRPVTQRDAGNYVIESNGDVNTTMEPLDMERILTDAARESTHELVPAPFLVDPHSRNTKAKILPYYSKSADFVAGFNSDYDGIISADFPRKGKNPTSPMVVYSGDEPQAMILPVRLNEEKSRIPAAVRAYFTDEPKEKGESVERLINEVSGLREEASRLEQDNAQLRRQLEELRQQYEQEREAQLQQDAAEVHQEQSPADMAAALVKKLTALEGVAVTVKGAQTAAPVVWLTGETSAHKNEIEKMGGKWSGKRSAWYFKIA